MVFVQGYSRATLYQADATPHPSMGIDMPPGNQS